MSAAGARGGSGGSSAVRGALWMIASVIAFTVMSTAIRPVSEHLHPIELLFFRNVIGVAVMTPWIVRVGVGALRTERLGLHVLRALLVLGAMLCWFYAVTQIPFVEAVSLSFTAPLFTTLFAALVLGEVVRVRRLAAIVLGLAGAAIILRPGFVEPSLAAGLALLNPLLWAGAVIVIKLLSRTDSSNAIVAYMFILLVPFSLAPALLVWKTPTLVALPWIAVIGFTGACGHFCATRAVAAAEASFVMPFEYIRLPLLGLVGYFAYGEVPDLWTLAGTAIILTSSMYVLYREATLERAGARAAPARTSPRPGASVGPD
ncbi:MAG: DMT family transporter [Alphaproteobacteria bacterium]